MKVIFSAAARTDLREIGWHIAADNVPRSITFVEELRDRCLSLSAHPERFPEVAGVSDKPLRKMTHAGYLILYSIAPSRVEILRIVHGSRDWLRFFEA